VYVYAALGALGLTVASLAIASREPFEANLLRASGMPFAIQSDGRVRNALELHIVNKQGHSQRFSIEPESDRELEYAVATPSIELAPMAERRVPLLVLAPADGKLRKIVLWVRAGEEAQRVLAPFAAPR
jgi:hypothetical protein